MVGNDIKPEDYTKLHFRSAFERDIVSFIDVQEQIFDYSFQKLGISNSISHPVLLTECVGNPTSSRSSITQLLFEKYEIDSLCYGIDSLFSYKKNVNKSNGLILSSGFSSTLVLPYINGSLDYEHSKRLPIGGLETTDFLLRLMQLKYPSHRNILTIEKTEQMKHGHTICALNYIEELRALENRDNFNSFTHVFQLPYQSNKDPIVSEKRKQQGERMKKMVAQRKESKKQEDLDKLNELLSLKSLEKSEFEKMLQEYGFEKESKYEAEIKKLQKKLDIKEDLSSEPKELLQGDEKLVDIADEKLTPEELAKKKKLKGLVGAKRAREKKKIEKQKDDEKLLKKQKMEEEMKTKNPLEWIKMMKEKRQLILDQLNKIRKLQIELKDKRSATSKQRLKAMASAMEQDEKDEGFGVSDKDWDVYKLFSKDVDVGDESQVEAQLVKISKEISKFEEELGLIKNDYYSMLIEPQMNLTDEQANQIHMTIERIRVPEVIFQPCMIGKDYMGLAEIIENVLEQFSKEKQEEMIQNIYCCGGNTGYKNFKERIEYEVRMVRPFGSKFNVEIQNSDLDSWKGAAQFAMEDDFKKYCITKKEFEENGYEYFKENPFGNKK